MCTDVDRNDKSRICEPGSVRVLGRRQIEMYSRFVTRANCIGNRGCKTSYRLISRCSGFGVAG